MLVTIKPDVTGSPSEFSQLDRILYRIEDGAHDWEIEDEDALLTSPWLISRAHHQEFVRGLIKDSTYPKAPRFSRKLVVCATPQANAQPTELPPKQAAQFVSKPLYVLMENKFTDGTLLDIAIKFLAPSHIAALHTDPRIELIEYVGAGGLGEIPKHIADRRQQAAERGIPLRLIVFTDSDGLVPGKLHQGAETVATACKNAGIPCCILSKRAIENYIPDEVFDAWVSDRNNTTSIPKIAVLNAFTQPQRDHLAIKVGFGDKPNDRHDVALYAELTSDQRKEWVRGLGDSVIYRLKEYQAVLSAEALRRRDHAGDLDKIIQMIMSEL